MKHRVYLVVLNKKKGESTGIRLDIWYLIIKSSMQLQSDKLFERFLCHLSFEILLLKLRPNSIALLHQKKS